MAAATTNLKEARWEVADQLYQDEEVIRGTSDSGSTTSIVDTLLEQEILTSNNFIGSWAYVPAVAAPKASRITAYAQDTGTFTLSPALGATAGTNPYEVHYGLSPTRLNSFIAHRARIASLGALTSIAESTSIPLDKFVLVEGVLADCKRYLAKRERGAMRDDLEAQADDHEANWQEGLLTVGYGPSWMGKQPKTEETEANSALRRI